MSKTVVSPKKPIPESPKSGRSLQDRLALRDRSVRIGFLVLGVLLALVIGVGTGVLIGRLPIAELEERLASANRRNSQLAAENNELQDEVQGSSEAVASLDGEVATLKGRIANLKERALKTKQLRAREKTLDKRKKSQNDRAAHLDARAGNLDARRTDLDQRANRLDRRAASIRDQERAFKDATFGDGIYAIGQDIAAGIYSTAGGNGCRWARLSGLGGTPGEVISKHRGPGPQRVQISSSDAAFRTSGCGRWSRG